MAFPRIWYRDVATNELSGPLQQPLHPRPGQDTVLESDIRAVFPLGAPDATHVYPVGTIFQPCSWDGTTFTNGPPPSRVPSTRLARVQWRARQQARRIQTWQGEVRESYGRVYASDDLGKIRDALVFALSGLNRFLRGGRTLAEKETALIGWAAGPTGAATLPSFATAAAAATAKTTGYVWSSWRTGRAIALGATPPTGLQLAAAPDPDDLLDVAWIGRLT